MPTLISRTEALARHPLLASVVLGVQAAHDPGNAPHRAGDRVWIADSGPTVLDAATADRLNAGLASEHRARCDQLPIPAIGDAYAGEIVLQADGEDADTAIVRCANGLSGLAAALGWSEVTFIGDFAVPLVPARSRHRPAVTARARLAAQGIDTAYCGAVVAAGADIAAVARDLWTVVRYEGGAPDIRLHAEGAPCVGSLCPYANLHLDVYGTSGQARIMAAIEEAGLSRAAGGCFERFGENGRIKGRRIDV